MSGPLLIALPLYREVSVEWLIRFLNMSKTYVSGIRYTRKLYLAKSMKQLVEDCLGAEEPWTRLVVHEADMEPPIDGYDRIAAYPDELDIVGSIYCQHSHPYNFVIYDQIEPTVFQPLEPAKVEKMMNSPGIYPADAVGMGFTSIHRRVFEQWDSDIPLWEGGPNTGGHDLWHCTKAREQGFNVNVDSGLVCGHLTTHPITPADTFRAWAELTAQNTTETVGVQVDA